MIVVLLGIVWVRLLLTMTKLWSATSLVALGLLGCLTWTNVEAQKKFITYRQTSGQNTQSQNSASSYIRQSHDEQKLSKKNPNAPEIEVTTCDVPTPHRVPCGESTISFDECKALSCCYEAGQCFFGKSVTVQCTRDGYFIVVVARDATQPGIDFDTLNLIGQGEECRQKASNLYFSVFHFPVTACGTEILDDFGAIVYKNSLTCEYLVQTGQQGSITRNSLFELLFECKYTATSVEYVNLELALQSPPSNVHEEGPLRVELKLANGICIEKGCTVDSYYSSFYGEGDYPVSKTLREPVYVQVAVVNRMDPLASLILHRCWATANPSPHSMPQWDILIDGCPNMRDSHFTQLVPMDYSGDGIIYEHYKRFMFHMFVFVNSSEKSQRIQQVYIHCSTSICLMIPGRVCQRPCARMKRDIAEEVAETSGLKSVGSVGPLSFTDHETAEQ